MNKQKNILILVFLWAAFSIFTEEIVQNIDEQYLNEIGAVIMDSTETIDGIVYFDGELFSGYLFSRYENGKLEEFEHYENGVLNGSAARWYENGRKQMEAMFQNGKLNGYFVGWFENGDLKYDFNFADESRNEEASEEDEKESDSDNSLKD